MATSRRKFPSSSPAGHDEDHGEGDLGHHQRGTHAVAPSGSCTARAQTAQCGRLSQSQPQRRRHAEQDAVDYRQRQGKAEDRGIRARGGQPGNAHRRTCGQYLPRCCRERKTTKPPASASTQLSVRSWRTMRPRPAPIASLTAISRCRERPRASSRLATFEQPISMNRRAAAINISRAFRAPPTIRSRRKFRRSTWSRLVAGNSREPGHR